jgi:hypothetical protein
VSRDLDNLSGVVASLQEQLNSLAAQMQQSTRTLPPVSFPTPDSDSLDYPISIGSIKTLSTNLETPWRVIDSPDQLHWSKRNAKRFYGPTSPDYSFNAAHLKLRYGSWSSTNSDNHKASSLDEDQFNDDEVSRGVDDESSIPQIHSASSTSQHRLLQFSDFLSLSQSTHLLYLYEEVVGEFHPILDVDYLVKATEVCYNELSSGHDSGERNESPVDEEDLLIINLAIAVALCAGSSSQFETGKAIFNVCKGIVGPRLTSPAASVKFAIITTLIV